MELHGRPTLQAARSSGATKDSETARVLGVSAATVRGRAKALGFREELDRVYFENKHGGENPHTSPRPVEGSVQSSGRQDKDLQENGRSAPPDPATSEGRKVLNSDALVKDLRKENKRLTKLLLDQENLFDRIVAASTEPLPRPAYRVRAKARSDKPRRAVMLPIFDCQFGQRVRPDDTVGGIGGFDDKVFAERVGIYVEKQARTMQDYAAGHALEELVIPIGGDTVEGDEVYGGMEWQLCLDPPEQVMGMRDHLAYIVDALMEAGAALGVRSVSILCTPGNHGKVGGKRGGARPKTYNWDVLVYKLLREKLANHPIRTFAVEPAGNCLFDVKGNLCSMIHGDEVKGWGGLPFYGLTRHDARMIRTLNVIPEYVFLGHHHTPASIPIGYGEHLMSGNWVGANNLSNIVGSNTPSQWFFGVSEEWGVCDRSLIYLDERRKPTPTIHQTA